MSWRLPREEVLKFHLNFTGGIALVFMAASLIRFVVTAFQIEKDVKVSRFVMATVLVAIGVSAGVVLLLLSGRWIP